MEEKSSLSPKNLLASIFKYSIATYINFFIYGISILLVAWFVDSAVWGQFDIFVSASTLIMNICILGLDSSFIRFFNEPPSPLNKSKLFGVCFGISAIILILSGLVSYLLFPDFILGLFFNVPMAKMYLALMFFNAFMSMIARYVNILYRMDGNIKLYTFQSVLMQFFSKLFFLFGIIFSPSLENLIFWFTLGMTGFSLIFLFAHRGRLVFDSKTLFSTANKQILPYGIAIAPTAIMLWLNSLFSKVYLSKTIGDEATGVFSMVNLLSNVIAIIQAGFATFWSAFIYANYKQEQEKIKHVHDYLTYLIVSFFCIIVAFEDVIFLFLGPSYKSGMAVFPIMLLVPIFAIISETTVYGISIAKKPIFDTMGIAISVISNIMFCMLLAPSYGLYGVCIALALSNIVMFLFRTIIAQKLYSSILSPARTSLVLVILIILTALTTLFSYNFYIKLAISFSGIGVYTLIYRTQLKNAIKLGKEILQSLKK